MTPGFTTFYRSPYPYSLEQSLIDQIVIYKKQNPIQPLYIIVPNHYIGAHLRHTLATHQSHIQVFFVTMEEFAKKLLSTHATFLQRKKLPLEAELLHIGDICRKKLKGTSFEGVATKHGFHKNLRNFFHHLISEESNHVPDINSKTASFGSVFTSYLQIKKQYHHGLWNIELASKTELRIDGPVFVYGFSHFSKLERSFLDQIAKETSLHVWMEMFTIENFQIHTLNWLDQHFQDVEDLEEQTRIGKVLAQPCHHIEDESLWIAKTIIERQKSNPIPFHRFGIFLNDYETQKPYIEKTLRSFGIPTVPLYGNSLSQTRMGLGMSQLIRLLLTNWSRNQWFDFLQTFPLDRSFMENNGNPMDWNQFSVDAGISTKNAFFFERLEFLQSKTKDSKLLSFIAFQREMLSVVTRLEELISKSSFKSFSQELNIFFQKYAEPTAVTDATLLFFDEFLYICSEISASTPWIDVQNSFLEKMYRTIEESPRFESDGVLIAPFSMMQSLFFDVIFLPHMNETHFPKNELPLFDLHVDELKQISEKARISFDQVQKQIDIQSSMLDSAKYHCTESLHLSYSMYSIPKEDDLKPSILIHPYIQITNLFDSSTIHAGSDEKLPDSTIQQIKRWVESEQGRQWTEFNAFADAATIHKDVYSATELSRYADCPKRYFLANVLGLIPEEYLEEYPHMQPKDRGTLIHEILFRFFLELKVKNLIPLKKENRSTMIDMLTAICSDTFNHYQTLYSYGIPGLWTIDEKELLSDLTAYLDREIQSSTYWIPYSFEHRFGMRKIEGQDDDPHSSEKPLAISIDGKKLLFKGKVDRIDVSPDKQRMRIVDYKTGKLFEKKSWSYEKGTNLQIPLYLLLSDQFFDQKPTDSEGKLVSLQAISKFDERKLSKTDLSSKEHELTQHLNLIDHGIRHGNFFPNPESGGSNCKFCDFVSLCGKNIHQTTENIEPTDYMTTFFDSKKALP